MVEPVTDELLHEVSKSLQEGQAPLRREVGEIRGEWRSTGEQLAPLSTSYAALVGAGVRRADRMADLRARVERIERRLELTDPPT
jgi:predicted nuclease with TOPRIM domain